MDDRIHLLDLSWVDGAVSAGSRVLVQMSAHGRPAPAVFAGGTVWFEQPQRRVAPGQSVVLYRDDSVLGGGLAA